MRDADPARLRLPNLAGLPVAVVTGDTSAFAPASPSIVAALRAGSFAAELLHLPDHGVTGNGHGLVYERNSDAALLPVLAWLDRHASHAPRGATRVDYTNRGERVMDEGFIGLGAMGSSMAANLAKAGQALRAWNRSADAARAIDA